MGYDGTNCKRMHRYYKSYVSKRPLGGRFYYDFIQSGHINLKVYININFLK